MPKDDLLAWYDRNKRKLPFRGLRDPYAVWISEIMLQQTRCETVEAYFNRFLDQFPDVRTLAAAGEQEVLKAWEGLGYYGRARNLHKAARIVVSQYGGVIPSDLASLRTLPGIGEYTAAAVASIAFGIAAPAVDGNLTRVLCRLYGIREDVERPQVKRDIRKMAETLFYGATRPGDLNQAMMDLGAALCVPGTPDCAACPIRVHCNAAGEGDADLLPVRSAAKPPLPVKMSVVLLTRGEAVLVARREQSLLQGMWVFFLLEGAQTRAETEKGLKSAGISAKYIGFLGDARHVFTHRIWEMKIYHFEAESSCAPSGAHFASADELSALPFPAAMRSARREAERILAVRRAR